MTEAPLPPSHVELLTLAGPGNRSLLFDRGFAAYDSRWSLAAGAKQDFLREFSERFSRPADFEPFVARRRTALDTLGACSVEAYTQTRLVTGLGLPSPTETGILLDRLTGSPYLPGSSLKGLLRSAARRVASGELVDGERLEPGDAAYWEKYWQVVFGPDKRETTPAQGQVVFFDAFPTEWPRLEVDVLTPHYQLYYGDPGSDVPPGDWHDPIPVAFLTVAAGTGFRFHFLDARSTGESADGCPAAPDPLPALERLLLTALDWLGIGAKTGSGYGILGTKPPAQAVPVAPPAPRGFQPPGTPGGRHQRFDPPPPKAIEPSKSPGETLWKNVELELWKGTPTIFKGNQTASCAKDEIPVALLKRLKRLKKGKTLRVDARVVTKRGGEWRIEEVTETE